MKLRSTEPEVLLDNLEIALESQNPDVISFMLGQRHQVHVPEALVKNNFNFYKRSETLFCLCILDCAHLLAAVAIKL